jgi:hypothetical protein
MPKGRREEHAVESQKGGGKSSKVEESAKTRETNGKIDVEQIIEETRTSITSQVAPTPTQSSLSSRLFGNQVHVRDDVRKSSDPEPWPKYDPSQDLARGYIPDFNSGPDPVTMSIVQADTEETKKSQKLARDRSLKQHEDTHESSAWFKQKAAEWAHIVPEKAGSPLNIMKYRSGFDTVLKKPNTSQLKRVREPSGDSLLAKGIADSRAEQAIPHERTRIGERRSVRNRTA